MKVHIFRSKNGESYRLHSLDVFAVDAQSACTLAYLHTKEESVSQIQAEASCPYMVVDDHVEVIDEHFTHCYKLTSISDADIPEFKLISKGGCDGNY